MQDMNFTSHVQHIGFEQSLRRSSPDEVAPKGNRKRTANIAFPVFQGSLEQLIRASDPTTPPRERGNVEALSPPRSIDPFQGSLQQLIRAIDPTTPPRERGNVEVISPLRLGDPLGDTSAARLNIANAPSTPEGELSRLAGRKGWNLETPPRIRRRVEKRRRVEVISPLRLGDPLGDTSAARLNIARAPFTPKRRELSMVDDGRKERNLLTPPRIKRGVEVLSPQRLGDPLGDISAARLNIAKAPSTPERRELSMLAGRKGWNLETPKRSAISVKATEVLAKVTAQLPLKNTGGGEASINLTPMKPLRFAASKEPTPTDQQRLDFSVVIQKPVASDE